MLHPVEDFYFSAFVGGQLFLYAYDPEVGAHRVLQTENDLDFRASSIVFKDDGKLLIKGAEFDADFNTNHGYELYSIGEDLNLRLEADFRPGPDSSHFDVDRITQIAGYPEDFITNARIDSDDYEVAVLTNGEQFQPFANYFSDFSTISDLLSPVTYNGQTTFLAKPDDGARVPWTIDFRDESFSILSSFDQDVGSFQFSGLYVLDETLFGIATTDLYGRELFALSENGFWSLVADISPGRRPGSPSWEFEFNGNHYFTAVNDQFGRELYRLDRENGLILVPEFIPGPDSSIYFTKEFEYDGSLYFFAYGSPRSTLFLQMDSDETLTEVASFVEDVPGSYPRILVDLDDELIVEGTLHGDTVGLNFIKSNDQLTRFELPEGELGSIQLLEGTLYVSMELADEGLHLYYMTPGEGDTWTSLVFIPDATYSNRVVDMSLVSRQVEETPPTYAGTREDETIVARDGGSVIYARGGDDVIVDGAGSDMIYGQTGVDALRLEGAQSSFTLELSALDHQLMNRVNAGQSPDVINGIEFLDFETEIAPFPGGAMPLFQFDGAGQISASEMGALVSLYIAYFNRAPDAIGLNYWATAYADGMTMSQIAASFIDQDETRATYPSTLSQEAFVTEVYSNVLGRAPDQDGYAFWVAELNSGDVGRDQFILAVLEGANAEAPSGAGREFVQQQQIDQAYLANKTDIGAFFAVIKGMSDVNHATAAMALFDGTQSSIDATVSAIEDFHTAALDPLSGEFLLTVVGVIDDPFA